VGLGTALLFTPAHPVAHVVQAGGLGILATEYDGPKKALDKRKNEASNLIKRFRGNSTSKLRDEAPEPTNQEEQSPANRSKPAEKDARPAFNNGFSHSSRSLRSLSSSIDSKAKPTMKPNGTVKRQASGSTRLSEGV